MFIQLKPCTIIFIALSFMGCSDSTSSGRNAKKLQIKIAKDKKEGTIKKYYSNGYFSETANYKNDTLNGTRVTYDENGKIYTKASYKMGVFVDSLSSIFQMVKSNQNHGLTLREKSKVYIKYIMRTAQ